MTKTRQAKQKQTPIEKGKQSPKPATKHNASSFLKIYACLHKDCFETFEVWEKLNNHMDICKVKGIRCIGKRKMGMSRRKGNNLIKLGLAIKREYPPLPTDVAELVEAIRDFCKNKKGVKIDESLIVRQVIQPKWGVFTDFVNLGFGSWKEFINANPTAAQHAKLRVDKNENGKTGTQSVHASAKGKTPEKIAESLDIYEIVLKPGSIGLVLMKGNRVKRINQNNQCAGKVAVGDYMVEFDGIDVSNMTIEDITVIVKERTGKSKTMKLTSRGGQA